MVKNSFSLLALIFNFHFHLFNKLTSTVEEFLEGPMKESYASNLAYTIFVSVLEEGLEVLGVWLFLKAMYLYLVEYIQESGSDLSLKL